ncbi:MAG: phosphatase PAP2 family protein [Clostridia bacterium]|nr:phosphatase PAP2 family protein [Clostridia bacterium]
MNFVDLMQSFDLTVLDRLQTLEPGSAAERIWKFITLFAESGIFWIVLSVVLLLFRRTRRWGLAMGIALTLGLIVGNMVLKNAVARIRPYDVNVYYPLIIERLTDYSFPSGHTMGALGPALAIFWYNKKAGIPAVIFAALISISRLHLYAHYPSDVLGGAAVALFTSLAGWLLSELIMNKLEPKLDVLSARVKEKVRSRKGSSR